MGGIWQYAAMLNYFLTNNLKMKKIIFALAAFLMIGVSARADEGMWLLPLLQKMNSKALASTGCELTPEQIYNINNSSLKDAIVHFGGGCTGEMISDRGLLVTNHHCGYGSIQKLSSTEHNYLEDGYWAMTDNDEIPVPGLTVTFLESITDITKVITKTYDEALKQYKDSTNKDIIALKTMRKAAAKYEKAAAADYPGCEVNVVDFYNNNVFYLIVYKVYKDIRFVGAPPASLGKFGGDTDNWMWPRQTCDFSMFRVYAGKENEPADYSAENIPYSPKRSLNISLKGVKDGDFAMVMGYPGRTQRFQTADQLEDMMAGYAVAVKARTVRQDIMMKGMEADPAVRLKYANKYASSSNGWKKWQGEQLSVEKLDIIGRERRKEAEFMKWVNRCNKRKEAYGTAIQDIKEAVESSAESSRAQTLLTQSLYNIGPINVSSAFLQAVTKNLKDEKADTAIAVISALKAASAKFKDYDAALEKEITKAMLKFYRDNSLPEYYINGIGDFKNMDLDEYTENMFKNSIFASPENLNGAAISKLKELQSDPAIILQENIAKVLVKLYFPQMAVRNKIASGSKRFNAGLMEWKHKEPLYPDANSTMRLTYGNVKSYSPKDGVLYKHYTTLKGVIEKEDPDNYEFRVPARLKELYYSGDFGRYADNNGVLNTCFLTNNDITGGNSGSPVLNSKGELIGLAFDGNWESMSSDIMFEPDLQRCICVDIRYVLFIVDKFGGAGRLIDEMKIID